jgi:hypothetical protein
LSSLPGKVHRGGQSLARRGTAENDDFVSRRRHLIKQRDYLLDRIFGILRRVSRRVRNRLVADVLDAIVLCSPGYLIARFRRRLRGIVPTSHGEQENQTNCAKPQVLPSIPHLRHLVRE